ncbi:Hypothetical predicted protein [Olea europaea subsp. europaea]|uniref:Uncharacterized protein n=1 Tax=Olea europaea subsp. europaea TaxID=158383 RepID=A0A8S0R4G4_OLEEU|nr:Hypothetical predicted protein [Olea europaea subsp. europaea]
MPVQESLEETLQSQRMKEYEDEAEETLSLCDLPLYSTDGGAADWEEDLSTVSQGGSSSTSSLEQDYFEFFSQHMSTSTTPENIIFCGKIIPCKQPAKDSKLVESKQSEGLSRLKLNSLFSKNGAKSPPMEKNIKKKSLAILPKSSKKMYNKSNDMGKGNDFPVQKTSLLTSSSSGKARWYFLLFGITGISTEMKFSDMKNRQSRRKSSPSSPMFRFRSGDDKAMSSRGSKGKGAWRLIRALSCHHADAVVTDCIRRE